MKNEINNEYTKNLGLGEEATLPEFYRVIIHNDDFTPMEFVMNMLEKFFYMDRRKAAETMLEAHMQGRAALGMYTKDVAESKIVEVREYAKLHQHPFNCSMEIA